MNKQNRNRLDLCLEVSSYSPVAWPTPSCSDVEEFYSDDVASSEEDEDYVPSGEQ